LKASRSSEGVDNDSEDEDLEESGKLDDIFEGENHKKNGDKAEYEKKEKYVENLQSGKRPDVQAEKLDAKMNKSESESESESESGSDSD